jgi:hypothetical protein
MSKITFRRSHPGGGPLGRVSYGIAGVPGIVVIDRGMFVGEPPATIELDCTLAEAKAKPAKVAPAAPAVEAPAAPAKAEGIVTKAKGKLVKSTVA